MVNCIYRMVSDLEFRKYCTFLSEASVNLIHSVDPNEMLHHAAFHLGLHCLFKCPFRAVQYRKVNGLSYNKFPCLTIYETVCKSPTESEGPTCIIVRCSVPFITRGYLWQRTLRLVEIRGKPFNYITFLVVYMYRSM